MTCPRCAAAEISPLTGRCDLCGYAVAGPLPADASDGVDELAVRQLAHEFAFGDLVGRGRESAVHRAREVGSGRAVLVKVILRRSEDPEAAESFRSTMLAFQQVDHPNLLPVLRFGSTDSLFWFATDDRGASTLRQRMRAEPQLDLRTTRRVLLQLSSALDYLHRRGLVHGAVKADNVLMDSHGWVGLTDANIARPRWRRPSRPVPTQPLPRQSPPQGRPTPPMAMPGVTPERLPAVPPPADASAPIRDPWVAPEEFSRGDRFPAADQYALGALAHEMLAGEAFSSTARPLSEVRGDLPARCGRAIERALSTTPGQRFGSCGEFAVALEEDSSVSAQPAARVTSDVVMVRDWEPPDHARRRVLRTMKGIVTAVIVIGLLVAIPVIKGMLAPAEPSIVSVPLEEPGSKGVPSDVTPRTVLRPEDPLAGTTSSAPVITPNRPAPTREPPARPAAPRATQPQPATPAPEPVPTSRIFINAQPWGQVFIDGASVGNTPRANLPITPGAHVVRVVREGFTPWERTIRIAAGDTLRFTDIVLAPINP